jgi:membrane protein YqaA with SNARE-associated domain
LLVSWGPLGVFFLAIIDSAGIPMVAGVDALVVLIAVWDRAHGYQAAVAATLGSIVGSMALFLIARKGGEEYLHRYTSSGRGARMRAWFVEYGLLTVFVPALVVVPLPLKLFVLSAGALEVNPVRFGVVLFLARIPRYFFLAWLGSRLGKDTLPYLQHHAWQFLVFAVALFGALYLFIRFVHRRKQHLLTDLE